MTREDTIVADREPAPAVLTHAELPAYLARKRPRSVERAAREGRLGPIKPFRLGGAVHYLASDVAAYIAPQIASRGAKEAAQ